MPWSVRSRIGAVPRVVRVALITILVAAVGSGPAISSAETTERPGASTSVGLAVTEAPCLTGSGTADTRFVTTDGSRFLCGGRPLRLSGFTMYPALLGGASAWHRADFPAYIDQMLDLGASAGLNLVRPTDEWDSHTPGQTWSDPVVWKNLDYLVAAARRRGMFVVLDLSAFRWLLVSQGRDPFVADAWREFVEFAAARYRDDPAVAFYSIVGEPAPPATRAGFDSLAAFYQALLDAIHAEDPNHLVTLGALNHMEQESAALPWWQMLYTLRGNDIVAFKTYSEHDMRLLPTIAAYGRQVGKPLFEGEFGMPQGLGDATPAPTAAFNGLAESRASFFERVYRLGAAQGVAAFVFWNLGCQLRGTSFEVSPRTPAVWQVIASNAPAVPVPVARDPCGSGVSPG